MVSKYKQAILEALSEHGKSKQWIHLKSIQNFFKKSEQNKGNVLYSGWQKRLRHQLSRLEELGKIESNQSRFHLVKQSITHAPLSSASQQISTLKTKLNLAMQENAKLKRVKPVRPTQLVLPTSPVSSEVGQREHELVDYQMEIHQKNQQISEFKSQIESLQNSIQLLQTNLHEQSNASVAFRDQRDVLTLELDASRLALDASASSFGQFRLENQLVVRQLNSRIMDLEKHIEFLSNRIHSFRQGMDSCQNLFQFEKTTCMGKFEEVAMEIESLMDSMQDNMNRTFVTCHDALPRVD